MADNNDNPLLEDLELPPFSRIGAEHVLPAVQTLLARGRGRIAEVLDAAEEPAWESVVQAVGEMDDRIGRAWSPVAHLNAVADNPQLREAHNAALPLLSEYATEMGQNEGLYHSYRRIAEARGLDPSQEKVLANALRDFRLAGVDLAPDGKARYKKITTRLAELQSKFSENVLDATQAWKKHISDVERLAGLPESALALAADTAKREGTDGWLLTLEFPSYHPVMIYADDERLRREIYEANSTRASDQGPNAHTWDNSDVIEEIMRLRHRRAELLGFGNYAEYSLARKMARGTLQVMEFLQDLARRARSVASNELQELREFARERFGKKTLEAWDIPYYSEKLRQLRYDFSQEELRAYFPAARVLDGMFQVVHRLYGLDIASVEGIDTWHPDVLFFQIHDADGELRGRFYLDLYARPHKRGGAWMDECRVRMRTSSGVQTPVAYLSCNFTPPVGGQASLLTHDEVTTLFHEFGHGLHHMLTRVDYPSISGINGVAWDAVELPSQFLENWCWDEQALSVISGHVETGQPLPAQLFARLKDARNFQSGMQMLRQIEFALFDFRLHLEYHPEHGANVNELLDQVRAEVAVLIPPRFNRFAHAFSHIFGGGYAAGYYSYKWAEVLSSDAFSKFEENGIFDRKTGLEFLHGILEKGGSRDAMTLFVDFRGREPRIDALLRHSGITKEVAA
ncbi:MAG: oligopeptidase A [Gammaproteobacteria bacterium]|nr:MAG: oligopeptidase A [Gammaproteobacteria bacterium]